MFLKKLLHTNPELVRYAKYLHESGIIRPDSYVLDVDTILKNANMMLDCANREHVELLFMLKQLGRNPYLAQKLMELGYHGAVCVDYKEAQCMIKHHIPLGNVGHLVQIPKHLLKEIIVSRPAQITVYTAEKIIQIQDVAKELDIHVSLTLKVVRKEDMIYKSQEGGFALDELDMVIKLVENLSHVHIEGVTAFPCFLYDEVRKENISTPNAQTICLAKACLEEHGCTIKHVNMPSASCMDTIPRIHAMGGNQAEPGHALTGTTPFHVDHEEGYEKPAYVYVSEISHQCADRSYAFGGGYYRRGHLKEALVNDTIVQAYPMEDSAIDYHFTLQRGKEHVGDGVIFCFRTQMFVTRSDVVLVEGLHTGNPHVVGIYDALGKKIS